MFRVRVAARLTTMKQFVDDELETLKLDLKRSQDVIKVRCVVKLRLI